MFRIQSSLHIGLILFIGMVTFRFTPAKEITVEGQLVGNQIQLDYSSFRPSGGEYPTPYPTLESTPTPSPTASPTPLPCSGDHSDYENAGYCQQQKIDEELNPFCSDPELAEKCEECEQIVQDLADKLFNEEADKCEKFHPDNPFRFGGPEEEETEEDPYAKYDECMNDASKKAEEAEDEYWQENCWEMNHEWA